MADNPYFLDDATADMTRRDSVNKNSSAVASSRNTHAKASKDTSNRRGSRVSSQKSNKVDRDVEKILRITNMEYKKASAFSVTKK